MGQKVNPVGFRLGVIRDWNSTWYAAPRDFATKLLGDIKARNFLRKKLAGAGVSGIDIQRLAQSAKVSIHAARPGVVIGRSGSDVEQLRNELTKILSVPVHVNIEEIRRPELDAMLVAESVAQQLEKRVMFRRAMKRAVQNALRSGAKGIKIMVSGRLGGAEIARSEWYREGRVPLHTLRADIDYATGKALTTYGIIGVKVWIFKGEVLTAKGPDQKLSLNTEFEGQEDKKPRKRSSEKRPAEESKADKPSAKTVVKKKSVKVNAAPEVAA
jgi:small subunit ribosomal protein S3